MSARYVRTGAGDLLDFVESTFSIECAGCGNGTNALSTSSEIAAANEFYKDGWRVEDDEIHCPECAGTQFEQGG